MQHFRFRKPLVSMIAQGSAARLEPKASSIEELTDSNFQLVIDEPQIAATDHDRIRRVLLCSGKVYFTLRDARAKAEGSAMRPVRSSASSSHYPFPQKELADVLARYGRKQDVCWVQEEPKNRGAWTFMEPRLRTMLPDTIVNYIGRDAAASPATGSMKQAYRRRALPRSSQQRWLILHPKEPGGRLRHRRRDPQRPRPARRQSLDEARKYGRDTGSPRQTPRRNCGIKPRHQWWRKCRDVALWAAALCMNPRIRISMRNRRPRSARSRTTAATSTAIG